MTQDVVKNQLRLLEKTIRYLGKGSEWLMLEPVNNDLLESLEYIQPLIAETNQPSNLQKPIIKRPASLQDNQKAPSPTPPLINPQPPSIPKVEEVQKSTSATPDLDPLKAANLDSLKLRLRDCDRCQLCQGRSTVVFGQGNQKSDIVFIGEGPGEEEDRTGLAFVGKAGKLLTQIIHSIGLNRDAVYICNVVKCRPPGNRNPNTDEITACYPFLQKQLEFLQPKMIVTMGNIATKALLPDALGIMKMRGRIIDFNGTTLIPTFHPSYLLRNPSALADVWTDMRKIRQTLHTLRINQDP